jgi:allophanate hydrolase
MLLAVVGAHLRGMPLEPELRACGGRFERPVETSADYRLHALATSPPKPGLRRVRSGGVAIAAEVWSLPPEGFARFIAGIPRPLAIGRLTLADGSEVAGFVCEPEALLDAPDISLHGGWRAYLARS